MPKALDATFYIHEGVWTDWSKSKGINLILTLRPEHASILSPAVALLIAIAGTQLWAVLRFAIHQSRATKHKRDYLYHQQQVTLRNVATDLNTLWQLMRIGYAWRSSRQTKAFQRTIGLVLWALLHLVCVNLAATLSPSFLDAGDRVLSRSPYCGSFNEDYISTIFGATLPDHLNVEYTTDLRSRYSTSRQYTELCNATTQGCTVLPQTLISSNTSFYPGMCPFDASVCATDGRGTIVLDSGYISSHRDLGLNAPPHERISYRKVMKCSPLNDINYVTAWQTVPASEDSDSYNIVDAMYGPSMFSTRNATYSFSDYKKNMSPDQLSNVNPYVLHANFAAGGYPDQSDFAPISELNRTDADVVLLFSAFNAVYESAVNDPWFSATEVQTFAYNDMSKRINGTFYVKQRPLTTLACTEQHQFCNSETKNQHESPTECTGLGGIVQQNPDLNPPVIMFNLEQMATFARVISAAIDASIYRFVVYQGQDDLPLLAASDIVNYVGLALPDNQWQQEVKHWQALSMTMLQRSVLDSSTGQFAADVSYINTTNTDSQNRLCQNQIIRNSVYRSFNLPILVSIALISLIIIVMGLAVEDCVAFLRLKRLQYGKIKQEMWVLNGDLEMLRSLSEFRTGVVWTRGKNGVPLTAPGTQITVSDLRSERRGSPIGGYTFKSSWSLQDHQDERTSPELRSQSQVMSTFPAPKGLRTDKDKRFGFVNTFRNTSDELESLSGNNSYTRLRDDRSVERETVAYHL